MKNEVTGIMIYYYVVCKRKLWYFYNQIQMEQNSEDVKIGKALDENSYNREEKHVNIDGIINIDFIKAEGVVHEIKKSRNVEESSILQVKYYLYYLKKKGMDGLIGKIDYPLLKKTVCVNLTTEDEDYIKEIIKDINVLINEKNPPKIEEKKICKACAYHDICYI